MSRAQLQRRGVVIDLKTRRPLAPAGPTVTQLMQAVVAHPVGGAYASGNLSGKAAALTWLRLVKTRGPEMSGTPMLAWLVRRMAGQAQRADTEDQRAAWDGKVAGFLGLLEPFLLAAGAAYTSKVLDAATDESIASMLSDASQGEPDKAWLVRIRQARSDAARAGWQRRKASASAKTTTGAA